MTANMLAVGRSSPGKQYQFISLQNRLTFAWPGLDKLFNGFAAKIRMPN